MKYIYSAIIFFALSSNSSAINWVGVKGTDAYMDLDSITKWGDLTSITLSGNVIYIFDCKTKHYLDNGEKKSLQPKTPLFEVMTQACKNKWEIWK